MVLIEKTEVVAKKVPIEKQDADELNQGDERPEFKKEEGKVYIKYIYIYIYIYPLNYLFINF